MIEKRTLLQIFQEAYPKIRPIVAIILIIAISTSPVIDSLPWKIGVTSALGVTLLFLLFDLFKGINIRLDKIDYNLKVQEPPTYPNYNVALTAMKEILTDRLSHNKDVLIRIIGVSAQFSWKQLIEDTLPDLFNAGHKNPKIVVELLIVKPEVIEHWGQVGLKIDAETTLSRVPLFERKYAPEIQKGKISVAIFQYDNIPHWHGIMIDNDTFFMGRCKWETKDGRLHLQVGQKEYRQFNMNDNFKGNTRIELFNQWFEAYKLRASVLIKLKNNREGMQPAMEQVQIDHSSSTSPHIAL